MVKLDLRFSYCISVSGALKWIEMLVSTVVVGLVLWEVVKSGEPSNTQHLYDGEIYTCFTGLFTFGAVFLLLFMYFCVCGDGRPPHRRRLFATVVYTILVLMWIAAAGVEVWLSVDLKQRGVRGSKYNRRPAAAAFCFINILCCCASLYFAQFKDK